MAKILALDTSTDACSVALYIDGAVSEDFRIIPRQHTKQLLPMVDAMLADAGLTVSQLDAIAFGRGPGSFAGIRIATGVAQGLAFAAELPVVPVSTLAAIAFKAAQEHQASRIISTLDARMNELYCCAYEIQDGLPVAVGPEVVCPPANVILPDSGDWLGVGKGFVYLADMPAEVQRVIKEPVMDVYPSAAAMLALAVDDFAKGKTVAPDDALPVYLRDEVAWKKKDQQKKKHQ
ncbi:MAG: tRNA (adenosine(37)-N6)-threonylcarbamoyltransferase complex dimerization subunit type 1 TsaB [Amphritea sp.]